MKDYHIKLHLSKLSGSPTQITPVIIQQITIPENRVSISPIQGHNLSEFNIPPTISPIPAPSSP